MKDLTPFFLLSPCSLCIHLQYPVHLNFWSPVCKTPCQGILTEKGKWLSSFISGKDVCRILFYAVESARNGRYRKSRNLRSSMLRKRRAICREWTLRGRTLGKCCQETHKSLRTQSMEKMLEIEKEQWETACPNNFRPFMYLSDWFTFGWSSFPMQNKDERHCKYGFTVLTDTSVFSSPSH